MSNHTLWFVMGESGAGKDTLATMLSRLTEAVNVKWSRRMKDFVEECYDLAPGFLDDREKRLQLAPNGWTYLDIMVKLYHVWEEVDDALTARPTAEDIEEVLRYRDVVLTDTRKQCEVELGVDAALSTDSTIVVLRVRKPDSKRLSTDELLDVLCADLALQADYYWDVYNYGSIDDLEKNIKNILDVVNY